MGHIGERVLRVKRPNQQCQSTQGRYYTVLHHSKFPIASIYYNTL